MKVGQYSTVNGTKTFMRNTNNSLLSANIKLPANPTLSTVKKKNITTKNKTTPVKKKKVVVKKRFQSC
jgi:hypothetical protein|tara:strand:- start:66 stop:269 length:204 start_codon:yes stop_codon:yes gene_type:complete